MKGKSGDFPESRPKEPRESGSLRECVLQIVSVHPHGTPEAIFRKNVSCAGMNHPEGHGKSRAKYDLSIGSVGDKSRQMVIN